MAVVGISKDVGGKTTPCGLQVNTSGPVKVDIDMCKHVDVHAKAAGISLDQLKAAAVTRIPQGRFLDPGEVAHLAVYLGSSESDGMTGQTLTISGGMRMA